MSKEALAQAYSTFDRTQKVMAEEEVAPRYVLARMSALGRDVKSTVDVLLSTYESAQEAVRDSRQMINDPSESSLRRMEVPQRQFITAFKSVFFFVRAYQDAVCGFLFVLLQGKKAGVAKSMADALKKESKPIRELLDQELPDYAEWFWQWKESRDKIKRGADFALFFDAEDEVSISFEYAEEEGFHTDEERIGLQAVVEGLEMSAGVTAVAWSEVKGTLYELQWPPTSPPETHTSNE
jgi:hypothetical protein